MAQTKTTQNINSWPPSERPRERLWQLGVDALSDAELLALFLRSGRQGTNVHQLAQGLLADCGGLVGLAGQAPHKLLEVAGLGPAKVASLLAAFELGKRVLRSHMVKRPVIDAADDLFEWLRHEFVGCREEIFQAVLLDAGHQVLKLLPLAHGDSTHIALSIPYVLRQLLSEGCAAVIFVHNHPSGDPAPSDSDHDLTARLYEACTTIALPCLDHIIIGEQAYYSFAEVGLLG